MMLLFLCVNKCFIRNKCKYKNLSVTSKLRKFFVRKILGNYSPKNLNLADQILNIS